ncbi:sporulation integral membrane protein YlbJ [Bacillus ectoiniformans]|uniref:sporulation integral membrane protein YlbJ n=1 Tax=Bacillus ectoiniformans TaxID=1494429 RepID=UPI001EF7F447|nr:sporulation integral membrane protein YlbJ [Bacillus ectoiniformans]MBM7647236.1 sporulation integral membrane protein YlbJ [Bacillus ectoiniformans]
MAASRAKTILLAIFVTVFAGSLIAFPEASFEASIRGLNMWWEIVFPSLLPFFIISEMLIGIGVVSFLGVLLEPMMRPLFRVPGSGGFVWAMAMASGFPSGAKLAARLRKEKQLTRIEAERLVSFTNSSNPLFIFGAVSVGFFYNPHLGVLLALAHYGGNFLVGLTMRFYGREKEEEKARSKRVTLRSAFSAMHRERTKDERPIGKLIGEAVVSSINTLLMIGGFIILFSVINKLLFHLHVTEFLAMGAAQLFHLVGLSSLISIPFIAGIFEITLGSQMISQVQQVNLLQQVILTSFVLGFSGLSVQAQVASILAETDIRFAPFFMARIMHGFYSAMIAFVCWKPVYENSYQGGSSKSIPVFQSLQSPWEEAVSFLHQFGPVITIGALVLYMYFYARLAK